MRKPLSAKFDKRQRKALAEIQEDDHADNTSDAIRTAVDAGLAELGYINGEHEETRLEWLVGELARVFAYLGLGWLAATLYFPVGFRLYAVGWFVVALACMALQSILDSHEPGISHRLAQLTPGGDSEEVAADGGERA